MDSLPSKSDKSESPIEEDLRRELGRFTSARVALGRTGGSLRTRALLDFRLAHARARDAVWSPFDSMALARSLTDNGLAVEMLHTLALDRRTYVARPDLGRKLDPASQTRLKDRAASWGTRDLAILVSDGLSAQATEHHGVDTIVPMVRELETAGWTLYPVFIVPHARVKLQDEIGEILRPRHTLILLGERPGLGAPDSLGAYFTYQPREYRTDADRNCVSNIRPEGLSPSAAASKLACLLKASARLQVSGTKLKDVQDERASIFPLT